MTFINRARVTRVGGTTARPWRAAALAALVVLLACDRGEPARTGPRQPCRAAEAEAGLIAQQLRGGVAGLQGAKALPLEPPVGQYALVVVGEVEGEVGVWAVGPWLGGARILAIDGAARRWSDWGTAIDDDSPAGRQRSELSKRPEVELVRACVRQGQGASP